MHDKLGCRCKTNDKEKTKEMERREVGKVRRDSDIITVEEQF